MYLIRSPSERDFTRGVEQCLASLAWLYLTHRYDAETQEYLLRVLTLSGLDSWWWPACALWLAGNNDNATLFSAMATATQREGEVTWLKQGIEAIWSYAASKGAPVGDPPTCPTYLLAYGYRRDDYLRDLQHMYGGLVASRYTAIWPETYTPGAQSLAPLNVFRHAVAIMGETAGVIERLIGLGGGNGGSNR